MPSIPGLDVLPEYRLSGNEAAEIRALTQELAELGADPAAAEFYDGHWPAAGRLPDGLRRFIERFRRCEPAAAALVHGLPTDDAAIGPTPAHWESAVAQAGRGGPTEQGIQLALCGLLLGEPFAWATLQAGRIVQDILPIRGDEERQNGYSSENLLEFHTEDGFHPDRCDYLLLLGLRNRDRVPTIISAASDLDLSERDREILGGARFQIVPDTEHLRQLEARDPTHPALAKMRRMRDDPEPTAALFGDRADPYLRIDRPFMWPADEDAEASRALERLGGELERVQRDVVVEPGTLLVVDNYRAAHGRRPFRARYDGTDRWMKKLTVSRDLRRGDKVSGLHSHRVRL